MHVQHNFALMCIFLRSQVAFQDMLYLHVLVRMSVVSLCQSPSFSMVTLSMYSGPVYDATCGPYRCG